MLNEQIARDTVQALIKKGYNAKYTQTKEEAKKAVLELIPADASVGFGGSITTRELGILEELKAKGNTIFDHWQKGLSKEENLTIRRNQLLCDVFLSSANAVTTEGEIVNIDGNGNRVASTIYGPKEVVLIIGINKITEDLASAIKKSQEIAAVKNADRLHKATPCVSTGKCMDCSSPDRICNITVILHRRPGGDSNEGYHIIVVGEEIGF